MQELDIQKGEIFLEEKNRRKKPELGMIVGGTVNRPDWVSSYLIMNDFIGTIREDVILNSIFTYTELKSRG